jgi:hypothetical protein
MGMTIDESLEWLISRKEHYEMDDNCQELAKALDIAIETMRKYQKIQTIVKAWNDMNSFDSMVQISEVTNE